MRKVLFLETFEDRLCKMKYHKTEDQAFFKNQALTFDDILLVPNYSEVVPKEISLKSHFARDIELHSPILSAAMDTVTENKMARVMAQKGGLGVVHKNMSIKSQALEVKKVKKYESGMITDPITLEPHQKVKEALSVMKKYSISGVPITVKKKLVGILTHRDLRFETNLNQPISDLMTKEKLVTTKVGTTLEQAKDILHRYRIEKLPVVDEDKNIQGLITIKDIEKSTTHPLASKDAQGRLLVGAAVGVGPDAEKRVKALIEAEVDVLFIDTAHGHSKNVFETLRFIRKQHRDLVVVAGNVVTQKGTEDLIEIGADVIKVGIGPGSICTTRVVTGVGMPQVSALIECVKAAKKKGRSIVADGGIKYSGDLVKALALGAQSVMLGRLLAGTEESPGETILFQGETYKIYRGMGSLGAMKKGSKDRYGQHGIRDEGKLVPEGIEGRVPYRGKALSILDQLSGGLRSGMGYLGASSIEDLQEKARFVQISSQSLQESHVHHISITNEPLNYRME